MEPAMTDPTTTERLAAAAEAEDTQWGEDWPTLRPVLALPRAQRADLMDCYAELVEQLPEIQGLFDTDMPGEDAGKKPWADYARSLGVAVTARMTKDEIRDAVVSDSKVQANRLRRAAKLTRITGKLDDALRVCAENEAEYAAWAVEASDPELLTVFMRYAQRVALPEASRSAN